MDAYPTMLSTMQSISPWERPQSTIIVEVESVMRFGQYDDVSVDGTDRSSHSRHARERNRAIDVPVCQT
jgi:hypothetical protein